MHGYIYPNLGDDSVTHFNAMMRLGLSSPFDKDLSYYGYVYLGYPLQIISQLFNIKPIVVFLWMNVSILFTVGLTLYFVMSKLVNKEAGLLSLIIPTFVSGASLWYVYTGVMFNLINVGIMYPLVIYYFIQTVNGKASIYFLLPLVFITSTMHTSGLYLPFLTVFTLVLYAVYSIYSKRGIRWESVRTAGWVVVVNMLSIFILNPDTITALKLVLYKQYMRVIGQPLPDINIGGAAGIITGLSSYVLPFTDYVMLFITPAIIILILVGLSIRTRLEKMQRYTLFILICFAFLLMISAVFKITNDPVRQQVDLAIVLSLIATALAGIAIRKSSKITAIMLGVVIVLGLQANIVAWFKDNSAAKEVDKQAILYVNSLKEGTYSCSYEVNQDIYSLYLKQVYQHSGGDVYISRSEPMTSICDPSNPNYDGHGALLNADYELLKTFSDTQIRVSVYKTLGDK
jgi:hypothetical protein